MTTSILYSLDRFVFFSPSKDLTRPLLSPTSPDDPQPPPTYDHTYQEDQGGPRHYYNKPKSNIVLPAPARALQIGLDQISYEFDSTGQ